jgi:hypothetical protein
MTNIEALQQVRCWTEDDHILREDWAAGVRSQDIARKLGRHRDAVCRRARKLKLSPRCVRISAEQDLILRRDWAAYVPVQEIARKLNRSVGVVRGFVRERKLRRSGPATRAFAWAPDHLKAELPKLGPKAFCAACYAWRKQQCDSAKAEKIAALAAAVAKIVRRRGLSRNEKIKAMRESGLTLQAIGDRYGLTRERVRQIANQQTRKQVRRARSAPRHERNGTMKPKSQNQLTVLDAIEELERSIATARQELISILATTTAEELLDAFHRRQPAAHDPDEPNQGSAT